MGVGLSTTPLALIQQQLSRLVPWFTRNLSLVQVCILDQDRLLDMLLQLVNQQRSGLFSSLTGLKQSFP